ncbi:PPC domain-containing DNA-binding protein [Micromonospora sp. AMSO31t]|uniref:PPC domain-containing DNA-binding protein n=1 Tax=Micromonospora sp. AMSO31t TaxID=2650566 RepID=UPI00124B47AB|nr:PPC domain-containing DNA-binding protein [Micromonospora sp. AMSO31t]KAB1916293.1 DNA-binding protein [Micromonospora sp. AMSO31t]
MRVREVRHQTGRVLVVICDKEEEAVGAIVAALREQRLLAARVSAVGAFADAEVGWFDRNARDYRRIPVTEQVEVLSLLGDVAEQNGEPVLHVHTVLGRSDGNTVGGHLLRGQVWPTLEVIISEVAPELAKRVDPETGLALISGAD